MGERDEGRKPQMCYEEFVTYCLGCEFDEVLCTAYPWDYGYDWKGHGDAEWKMLCALCASTGTGRVERPQEDSRVLQAISYVGNAILAELRRAKEPSDE